MLYPASVTHLARLGFKKDPKIGPLVNHIFKSRIFSTFDRFEKLLLHLFASLPHPVVDVVVVVSVVNVVIVVVFRF